MNKKVVCLVFGIFLSLVSFFSFDNYVKADIDGLTVTPLIGDSDVTDRFQIIGDSNSERTLEISLSNFGIRRLHLKVVPTNATTSMDGKIVYTDDVKAGQYGLKYAFSDMTKSQKVTLAPNKTKDLKFKVKLPSKKLMAWFLEVLVSVH
ncbi:hypothetical protein ABB45_06325 [Companilactobacillus farciminis]|jgi:Bacterial protein of unknown function (DUF916).|nr:hypothetical protein ABB45_06325 [Companilactobacillus farciminis]GAQ02450.1 hypothetical protein NBRC111452_2293 [Companilactobacillus farciminis]